jgi:hypothetical protein
MAFAIFSHSIRYTLEYLAFKQSIAITKHSSLFELFLISKKMPNSIFQLNTKSSMCVGLSGWMKNCKGYFNRMPDLCYGTKILFCCSSIWNREC